LFFLIFIGNLASSGAVLGLSCQLTIAPDYLLKSSLSTKKDDRLADTSNTALSWKEPLEYGGLRRALQVCKSTTEDGRGAKFAKMENHLLKSELASSLTKNRLLPQLSADVSQKMPQLCVTPSLILTSTEKFSVTSACPVSSSVAVGVKDSVPESQSLMKEHITKRKALATKGTTAVGKPKPKPVKKAKLAEPEQADNDEVISSFELPDYQVTHEPVESEKVELFVSVDKEQMLEQLLRPVVDVPSLKVTTS